jgi:sulfur relay (sulfurtransferase) complex TusBCD TusD component (DsrE family)
MTLLPRLVLALGLCLGVVAPLLADDPDPLFINLTTDDSHRANMALNFGTNQLGRGHPLTVFLNDKGVLLGSKSQGAAFAEQQQSLADLMGKGAAVIACPMCMKHYGVAEADLIPGVQVGNPDLTGAALFKEDTRTLTW